MSTTGSGEDTRPPPPTNNIAGLAGGVSTTVFYALALIPAVFAFVFHLGAAYLSYQKYGSFLWAVVDFFFAVFYYPYYAFVLSKAPAPSTGLLGAVQTAGRRRR